MTAREEVLDRVRKALGRQPGQATQAPPEPRIRIPKIHLETRISLFAERLEALGGNVYRAVGLHQSKEIVAGILQGEGAVATNAPILQAAGITTLPGVMTGFTEELTLRQACSTTPFGITSADYGLAETGTLVVRSSSEARLPSLLPPVHIALLPASRLLTGLDEFYTLMPKPADESASTVFITGPSRSADIEMILVRGVHGPRAIHVIVVDEEIR